MKISRRKLSKMPDYELLKLYSGTGRKEYCGELLLRYLPMIYGVFLKYYNDGQEAKNAVSEFLAGCTQAIKEAEGEPQAILYALATGYAMTNGLPDSTAGGRAFNTGLSEREAAFAKLLSVKEPDALETFEKRKNELNRSQKESMSLFFFGDKSFQDIADMTGYLYGDIQGYIESGVRIICEPQQTVQGS